MSMRCKSWPGHTSTSVPEQVGNQQEILVSELSGQSNILMKAEQLGITLEKGSAEALSILTKVKGAGAGTGILLRLPADRWNFSSVANLEPASVLGPSTSIIAPSGSIAMGTILFVRPR